MTHTVLSGAGDKAPKLHPAAVAPACMCCKHTEAGGQAQGSPEPGLHVLIPTGSGFLPARYPRGESPSLREDRRTEFGDTQIKGDQAAQEQCQPGDYVLLCGKHLPFIP